MLAVRWTIWPRQGAYDSAKLPQTLDWHWSALQRRRSWTGARLATHGDGGRRLHPGEAVSSLSNEQPVARPILRWAGGKTWLVQQYPELFEVPHAKYIEPFLGGAALFVHVNPPISHISDTNRELIECYRQVGENPSAVWDQYSDLVDGHSPESYARARRATPVEASTRAARLIYLNRSCFNGIYRVNRAGEFNVPLGSPRFRGLSEATLKSFARRIQKAHLTCNDFQATTSRATEGDLLVLDPPYTVLHNRNGFVRYNERIFSWVDQKRLADEARSAARRGVKVIETNAAHPSVISLYPEELFHIQHIVRRSSVAASSHFRGEFGEVLIASRNVGVA